MSEKTTTYSQEELIDRISTALAEKSGTDLADFCNREFFWNIKYEGDSVWEDRDASGDPNKMENES